MPLQNVIMLQIGEGYEFFSTPSALYGVHTAEERGNGMNDEVKGIYRSILTNQIAEL